MGESRWGCRSRCCEGGGGVGVKVVSYNVRGLGGFEKRAEVRRFV